MYSKLNKSNKPKKTKQMTPNNSQHKTLQDHGGKWFENKGFTKNPFSPEPLGLDEVNTGAFVGRQEARKLIKDFVQENSGAIIVVSDIGYGKSTMMNFTEKCAKEAGKIILRIDPRHNQDQEKTIFFRALIKEIIVKFADKLNPGESKVFDDFIKSGKEEDFHNLFKTMTLLFRRHPSVLIMDDLDKLLDFKKHIYFVKEIIDLLPKNLQVITTGDISQIMNSKIVVSVIYQIFDFPVILDEITQISQLKEFVYGRMNAYFSGDKNIIFEDKIFELLLDRTRGNLREVFRYLSSLLKGDNYSNEELVSVMVKVDVMRLYPLDNTDKQILDVLAGKSMEISAIKSALAFNLSPQMIRNRLDEMHQNCLVYKYKSKENKKIIYQAPKIISIMMKESKDLWSSDQLKVQA